MKPGPTTMSWFVAVGVPPGSGVGVGVGVGVGEGVGVGVGEGDGVGVGSGVAAESLPPQPPNPVAAAIRAGHSKSVKIHAIRDRFDDMRTVPFPRFIQLATHHGA